MRYLKTLEITNLRRVCVSYFQLVSYHKGTPLRKGRKNLLNTQKDLSLSLVNSFVLLFNVKEAILISN